MDFKVAISLLTFLAALVTGKKSTNSESTKFHAPKTGEDVMSIIGHILEDPCMMPLEVGICKGKIPKIPRFYYSMETHKCQEFTFGGCGGNGNQFEDIAVCKLICESRSIFFQQAHKKGENTTKKEDITTTTSQPITENPLSPASTTNTAKGTKISENTTKKSME